MDNFFTELFSRFDVGVEVFGDGVTNLFDVISPLVLACFTCYLMFVTLEYLNGSVDFSGIIVDWMKRIFGFAVILGIGLNMGTYTSTVFPLVTGLGTELTQAWNGSSNTENIGSMLDSLVTKVSQITDTNESNADKMSDPNEPVDPSQPQPPQNDETILGSVVGVVDDITSLSIQSAMSGLSAKVSAVIRNFLIWAFAAIFLIVATAYLLIAQFTLIILAGLGPVFFAFALFPATRQYFNNWIGQILNNSFLFLIMNIATVVFINIIDKILDVYVDGARALNYAVTSESVITLMSLFLIFAVILLQLPNLASSLFGGLAAGGFGTLHSTARNLMPKSSSSKQSQSSKTSTATTNQIRPEAEGK